MKFSKIIIASSLVTVFCFGCSSMQHANSYKSESFDSIKNQNILVISRTPQESVRKSYEREISKQLRARGLNAAPSHLIFPDLQPLTNKTVERLAQTIAMFRNEGFEVILITSLKDVKEQEVLRNEEGFGSLLEYYGNKYVTLKGYYDDVNAPPKIYPLEMDYEPLPQKVVTFILEAVTYNLGLPDEQRLLSVVTTEFTNPKSASSIKKGFAKLLAEELE
ncbi:hypothetical protein [uncultured Croceitalea sp.]|uniref:hypothetical protein n=1 Tax=uncultured Croceitalea sp. TaxID=1798908 RepID=UPI00374E551A